MSSYKNSCLGLSHCVLYQQVQKRLRVPLRCHGDELVSRVLDAVEAVGGVTSSRASSTVNLARLVVDGEQIDVGADPRAMGGTSRISLNSADAQQLQQLPGVGPVIAERIVAWRMANGPFRSVAELGEVSGIGPAMIARIEDQVGM